jgi:hypothetical protein
MVSHVPVAVPRISIEAAIQGLRSELRQVLGVLGKVVEKIEQIEKKLKDLENASTSGPTVPIPPDAPRIVYNFEILPCANGSASFDISIDGGKSFPLGKRLGGLLGFIASGDKNRGVADPLIGWRSWEELTFLKDSSGKHFRKAYVNSMVNLLRDKLEGQGFSRDVIQTNEEKGVRLALKRGSRGLLRASTPGL